MNWLKQTDKPLFPDVLWSRPENKRFAGKLLIIGGHQQSFNAVSDAYAAALKAGIGTARVILPDSLQKMLLKVFPEAEYAASTPIGSFSRQALGTLLDAAEWADGVLLAGDFGRNSETAILLESFIEKYTGQVTLTCDSLDYFYKIPDKLVGRENTTLVGPVSQLQKLIPQLRQRDDLAQLLNKLSIFTSEHPSSIVTERSKQIVVSSGARVSTTPLKRRGWSTEQLAAYATVWLLQQPERPFEAITSSIWQMTSK